MTFSDVGFPVDLPMMLTKLHWGGHYLDGHLNHVALVRVLRHLWLSHQETLAGQLLKEFTSSMVAVSKIAPAVYRTVALPLAQTLVKCMDGPSVEIDISYSVASSTAEIVRAYIMHFIRQAPVAPIDWRRPATNCSCPHCRHVNVFLLDPVRTESSISANEKTRSHIQSNLWSIEIDYTTVRRGSPHSLTITKRNKRFGEELQKWNTRLKTAVSTLGQFDRNAMQRVLELDVIRLTTEAGIRAYLDATKGVRSPAPHRGANIVTSPVPAVSEAAAVPRYSQTAPSVPQSTLTTLPSPAASSPQTWQPPSGPTWPGYPVQYGPFPAPSPHARPPSIGRYGSPPSPYQHPYQLPPVSISQAGGPDTAAAHPSVVPTTPRATGSTFMLDPALQNGQSSASPPRSIIPAKRKVEDKENVEVVDLT
ncbi:Hypothetical protein D9617_5g071230 [Elsinoe fawcettii]|nr:Hypothetical protein D9617_5g071230 [Elsinoe fawcettii]